MFEQNANNYLQSKLQADVVAHNFNVSQVSLIISDALELSFLDTHIISCVAYYHDIGKGLIDQEVLYKKSGLTDAEFLEIKKHAPLGANVMKNNKHLKKYADYVLYHHEDFDGGGYFGLKGSRIPYVSRVVRIADYFESLCECRPYRDAYSIEKALEIMLTEKEKFDSSIFNKFLLSLNNKAIIGKLLRLYEKFSK